MAIRILFARHGKTNTNADGIIAGRYQAQLTDEGAMQAEELGKALRGIPIHAAYVSPLDRAQDTLHIAFPDPFFPIIVEPLIIERDFGSLEGRKNDGDYFGAWRTQRQNEMDGETIADVTERWRQFVEKLRAEYAGKDVIILVVAHGGLGCVARAFFEGEPADGNYLSVAPIPNGRYAEWTIQA